ncbi:hypothetical protein V5O48_016602, partial [Marasmius crinis-equi]
AEHVKRGTKRPHGSVKGKEVQKKVSKSIACKKPAHEKDLTSKKNKRGKAKQGDQEDLEGAGARSGDGGSDHNYDHKEKDDEDEDKDNKGNNEPNVNAITGKPYSPGPLSEELGDKAVKIYCDCMNKLEAIALSPNKPLHSILLHFNVGKPPGVRPPNPWNVFVLWYNMEGEYKKPEKWTIQTQTPYKLLWPSTWTATKERLNKHLDEVKSNPKKLSQYLDKMLKPVLYYVDHRILVWGAAHPTKPNNTSIGQGVMWSGSPLFARVKEHSETQVSRALQDMSTLIHMVQMEGTHASADVLDLYHEIHCSLKKPPAKKSKQDKHRHWLATIIHHNTSHLLKNKHNLVISNFVFRALNYQLVLRNYPEDTSVPGVRKVTLHNLGAGFLKVMVSARVEYVNKSVAGTLMEKDKCHKHLYVESWSEEDKAANPNIQEKVAVITNVAGAVVVLADGTVPKPDDSASGGTAPAAKETTVQPKKATLKKVITKTMSLYQDNNAEDNAEEELTPSQPHSSAFPTPDLGRFLKFQTFLHHQHHLWSLHRHNHCEGLPTAIPSI